ncbi:MAG: hypothetical protein SynsKO_26120 [Synoicihabitans sp.]
MVNRNERGLALLLVISLMALVTLLVVSLAMITRVETQVGIAQHRQQQAREHARLALDIALGRLQELAGPDQRVTATAEATGATNNVYWTGVWDTNATGTSPEAWLVSGTTPTPDSSDLEARDRILLVAGIEDDPALQVTAPLEPIIHAGEVRGGFAYFVADEGVKATLLPAPTPAAFGDIADQRRQLMGQVAPVGFSDQIEIDPLAEDFQTGLAAASDREQIRLMDPAVDEDEMKFYSHDYTIWSRGLLVDVPRGRLKTDLTTNGETEIPGLARFTELMTPERQQSLSPTFPIRPASGTSGELYDGIHPIITQVGLQFSLHTISATSRTLETRLRFFVELINPLSSALEPADLRLVVSGFPDEVEIESRTDGTTADHGSASISLHPLYALHSNSEGDPAIEFDLPFEDSVWAPGRVITWRLQSGETMGEAANREMVYDANTRTSFWRERPGVGLDGPDSLENTSELRFTGSEDWQLQLELLTVDGSVLSQVTLPDFFQIETAWQDANSTLPDFGVHARLVDRTESQDADGSSTWLREDLNTDLRRTDSTAELWVPTIDLESASYNVSFSPPNSGVEAEQLFNRDPNPWTGSSFYQPFYNSDVAFFELPKQPWRSVGSLQHLPFIDGPIYNVGNSWSERNAWFDRFFFSDPDLTPFTNHPNLQLVGEDGSTLDNSAPAQLWVKGAFNLNSTSSAAWQALFAGMATGGSPFTFDATVHDPETGEVNGTSSETISIPVARFAQSAGEMWEISPNESNYQAGLRQYRRGIRSLTADQILGLAEQIADNIRNRISQQGPFRCVESFLAPDPLFGDANVLEYSIQEYDAEVAPGERINWDQYFPDTPVKLDVASPGFLTSADLMTNLAPVLSPRSDTFVIRAYGEAVATTELASYPDDTEPQARAWLEAVVQRFPEGVSAADFVDGASGDWEEMISDPNWGRRFRIISMRWLTEDEL